MICHPFLKSFLRLSHLLYWYVVMSHDLLNLVTKSEWTFKMSNFVICIARRLIQILLIITSYIKDNAKVCLRFKVQIFWEGQRNLKKISYFVLTLCKWFKNNLVIFFKFCGFPTIYELFFYTFLDCQHAPTKCLRLSQKLPIWDNFIFIY